jgi:uncharacterized protein (DUF488 family)
LMRQLTSLYTIGYQRLGIEDFTALLARHEIQTLLDVRYTPWSRKPAFSRSRLSLSLEAAGIKYLHSRELGCLPEVRKELQTTGDWQRWASAYREHLASLGQAIDDILAPVAGKSVCLMCMEADPAQCHRSLLAAEIIRRGLADEVIHL